MKRRLWWAATATVLVAASSAGCGLLLNVQDLQTSDAGTPHPDAMPDVTAAPDAGACDASIGDVMVLFSDDFESVVGVGCGNWNVFHAVPLKRVSPGYCSAYACLVCSAAEQPDAADYGLTLLTSLGVDAGTLQASAYVAPASPDGGIDFNGSVQFAFYTLAMSSDGGLAGGGTPPPGLVSGGWTQTSDSRQVTQSLQSIKLLPEVTLASPSPCFLIDGVLLLRE